MELFDEKDYEKVVNSLQGVKINNLFARSVIEKKVMGKVFVDNRENPKTFYVVHPYGISLLFGTPYNSAFNKELLDYSLNLNKVRSNYEWMQAYPNEWDQVLSDLYGIHLVEPEEKPLAKEDRIIELHTRVNFKFNKDKYISSKRESIPKACIIVPTDKKFYEEMTGSVIPSYFWDSADDFLMNGIGYSVLINKQLATTAYSAFIHENMLEIGIETISSFRGKGFAQLACSALIDYCIENDFEPVWSCRLNNIGSFKLAAKLGFEVTKKIPFYRLSK